MSTEGPQILVSVAEDRMTAWVEIPAAPGASLDEVIARVHRELDAQRIRFGLRSANVQAAARTATEARTRQKVVVARGLPPRLPKVRWQYGFRAAASAGLGAIRSTVLDQIENRVRARTPIAEFAVEGEVLAGLDVYNQKVAPPDDDRNGLRAGHGVQFDQSARTFLSSAVGVPDIVNGQFVVRPLYRVEQDLHPWMGEIEFRGHVFVGASVHPGAVIHAEGSVFVAEDVTQAVIASGGNVVIGGSLVGNGKKMSDVRQTADELDSFDVRAGGAVRAVGIQNAEVHAVGDVGVDISVQHSRVEAGGSLSVASEHGKLVGGVCVAGEYLEARDIGSPQGQPGTVVVPSLKMYRSLMLATEEIQRLDQAIAKVNNAINMVVSKIKSLDSLPDWQRRAVQRCLEHREKLEATREARATELEATSRSASGPCPDGDTIRALGNLHRGVTVLIGAEELPIEQTVRNVVVSPGPNGIQVRPAADEDLDDAGGGSDAS